VRARGTNSSRESHLPAHREVAGGIRVDVLGHVDAKRPAGSSLAWLSILMWSSMFIGGIPRCAPSAELVIKFHGRHGAGAANPPDRCGAAGPRADCPDDVRVDDGRAVVVQANRRACLRERVVRRLVVAELPKWTPSTATAPPLACPRPLL